ncbi:Hexosaminidase D [Araneus ventricosus]|uniref:beta-N-acetylhexosaminidase n=1 Tax=Araneus ventricosus TaxID=182803 RepID=A0A4Y2IVZ8_ARAVE|nr:Hexosaminidase D [Araneus ventricosus]
MLVQAARHCPQHVLFSLWRRKSLLLGCVMVTSVFVVCLQFGSSGGNGHLVENGLPQQNGREEFPLGMAGVGGSHKTLIPRRNLSALNQRQDQNSIGIGEIRPGQLVDMSGKPPRYQQQPVAGDPHALNYVGAAPNSNNLADHMQVYDGGKAVPNPPPNNWQDPQQQQQGRTWQYQKNSANGNTGTTYFVPPLRVVHFDLKGAPPKVSYFKQIFPLLKEAGANAILMEYEDMFPFSGSLAAVSAKNAYSREDVQTILNLAKTHHFEVIPLVQTFGHLEFALKLKEFRELREVDDFPQAICPSRNESFSLVENIIDQVMAMHPNIRWLHVGCDEVYHLGYCSKCMRLDRDNLFLSHVARVARYVRDKHKVIPIIWDDMLRQMPTEKLKEFQLGQLVEPMVWTYVKDVYRFVPYNVWLSYSEVFPFVWAASAFKGAFGETLTVPNVKMHLENNEAWLDVMAEQHKKFGNFRGIVITGWQRYDHLATLCELLPAGLPSLVIDLLTVTQGYFSQQLFTKFHHILQCTVHQRSQVDFETDPHLWQRASSCFFPGSAVFRMTQHHSEAIKRVDDYLYDVTIHKAWLTDYNIRHNITSPMRVDEGLADYSSVYYPLTSLVRTARDALREVYDEYTVAEWIEQNIYPSIVKLEKLWKEATNLKRAKVWPKRPLPPLDLLKKYSVGVLNDDKDDSAVVPMV